MKFEDLNPEQRAAVEAGDGPLLIVAGPGTGKTKTLTARIAYLIAAHKAKPQEITALTFTNKAAREMRERVTGLLEPGAQIPRIATFHALGHEILSSQNDEPLQLVSNEDRLGIIRGLSKRVELKGFSTRELAARISRFKSSLHGEGSEAIAGLANAYDAMLAEKGFHDFDDLLRRTHALLSENESLRKKAAGSCRYLLIDEFQDTNELQYALLSLLQSGGNVFVIGDPLQSIYGFRGASGDIFARFKSEFPKHRSITLTTNYRSAPEIVALSNTVFPEAAHLTAHHKTGGHAQTVCILNEYSEAEWILNEIEHQLGGTDMLKGHAVDAGRARARRFSDYAVLYRTHRTARILEQKLADSGLPYQIAGDGSPYEHPLIKTILQALRSLADRKNPDRKFAALLQEVDTTAKLSHAVRQVIEKLGLQPKDDAESRILNQFMSTLVRFDDTPVREYLQHVDEISEQDFYDPQAEAVTLLTIHAAKGLEFTHVFLIGAEEGLLPFKRRDKKTDTDEEHRLFYVAATRAKNQLDILYAKTRGGEPARPSRFVESLPGEILQRVTDPAMADQQKRIQKRRQKRAQQTLF